MDPVTAYGLASLRLLLIDAAIRVQKKIQGLVHTGEVPGVFRDIQTRLHLLIGVLDRTQETNPEKLSPKDVAASDRVRSCYDQISQLEEILGKVTVTDSDSRLRKARKTIVSLMDEARAQTIAGRLMEDIQLLTYLIDDSRSVDTRDSGKEAQSPLLPIGIGSQDYTNITILEHLTDKVHWLLATRMENVPRDGQELFREIAKFKPMLTRLQEWSENYPKREAMAFTVEELFSREGPLQDFARVLASLASFFEDRASLDWPESILMELPQYLSVVRAGKSLVHSASEQDFLAVKED